MQILRRFNPPMLDVRDETYNYDCLANVIFFKSSLSPSKTNFSSHLRYRKQT